jgi:hypothetical protein
MQASGKKKKKKMQITGALTDLEIIVMWEMP